MIRDTSEQDAVLAPPAGFKLKRRAAWIGGVVTIVVASAMLLSAWRSSEHSVSATRLRIAEVGRGTLVRDASVNGRVVAAVSPTLYSTAPATVNLKVAAGDTVKKGQVLAVLESTCPTRSSASSRATSSSRPKWRASRSSPRSRS
jgi:HlyD family secretion protein